MKLIGIKFCGLCNPEIDYKDLICCLIDELSLYKHIALTYVINKPLDALIIINGCRIGCIERHKYMELVDEDRVILVNGNTLNLFPLEPDELCKSIIYDLRMRALIPIE